MKEYIERALAVQELEVLRQEYEMHDDCDELVARRCRDALSAVPAADVAEVRHAFWSDYGSGVCCTNCGVSLFHQDENNNWGIEPSKFMFCPSCGALMDEEADRETS